MGRVWKVLYLMPNREARKLTGKRRSDWPADVLANGASTSIDR